MRALTFVGLIAACSFTHGSLAHDDAHIGDGARTDGTTDGAIDASPDAQGCTTAGLTCTNGTAIAVMCNGACWVKCTQATSLANQAVASNACTAWGGKLAPLRSQADNDCVAVTLFPSQSSWIGFEQDSSATTKSGGWSWNGDGVTPTYTNWSSGQPNDLDGTEDGQEQCAYMPTTGTWQDTSCMDPNSFRFSCRRP